MRIVLRVEYVAVVKKCDFLLGLVDEPLHRLACPEPHDFRKVLQRPVSVPAAMAVGGLDDQHAIRVESREDDAKGGDLIGPAHVVPAGPFVVIQKLAGIIEKMRDFSNKLNDGIGSGITSRS